MRYFYYGFLHVGDWRILPWISTLDKSRGWEFTWLVFVFGVEDE